MKWFYLKKSIYHEGTLVMLLLAILRGDPLLNLKLQWEPQSSILSRHDKATPGKTFFRTYQAFIIFITSRDHHYFM